MENPSADSQKGRDSNSAIFLLNNNQIDISIEEKQYKMQQDEEAFIKKLKENMPNVLRYDKKIQSGEANEASKAIGCTN